MKGTEGKMYQLSNVLEKLPVVSFVPMNKLHNVPKLHKV